MQPQTTEVTLDAFRRALVETKRLNHSAVRAEHILLGLLQLGVGSASAALDSCGVDRDVVRRRLEASLPTAEVASHEGEYPYHPSGAAVLQQLFGAFPVGHTGPITSGRVLLSLLSADSAAINQAFAAAGVAISALAARISEGDEQPE